MKSFTNPTHFSEKIFTSDCFCNKRALSIYINDLMREKDLRAPDVYKRAGISKANWSNYISEKNNPTPENARRLLVGLKCTPEEAKVLLSFCGMNLILPQEMKLKEGRNCNNSNLVFKYLFSP